MSGDCDGDGDNGGGGESGGIGGASLGGVARAGGVVAEGGGGAVARGGGGESGGIGGASLGDGALVRACGVVAGALGGVVVGVLGGGENRYMGVLLCSCRSAVCFFCFSSSELLVEDGDVLLLFLSR